MKRIYNFIRLKFASPSKRASLYKKKGVRMGDGCTVYKNSSFGSEPYLIKLGNNCTIGQEVAFITHDGGVAVLRNLYDDLKDIDVFGKIELGNNVFVGHRSMIMPNVTIGDNVIIGAGAVVTKSFPSNVIIAGVPAKIIKDLDEYENSVKNKLHRTKLMSKKEKETYIRDKFKL